MERHRQPWTITELRWLQGMAQRGISWGIIAGSMGRTPCACYHRYAMIRFSLYFSKGLNEQTMREYYKETI